MVYVRIVLHTPYQQRREFSISSSWKDYQSLDRIEVYTIDSDGDSYYSSGYDVSVEIDLYKDGRVSISGGFHDPKQPERSTLRQYWFLLEARSLQILQIFILALRCQSPSVIVLLSVMPIGGRSHHTYPDRYSRLR